MMSAASGVGTPPNDHPRGQAGDDPECRRQCHQGVRTLDDRRRPFEFFEQRLEHDPSKMDLAEALFTPLPRRPGRPPFRSVSATTAAWRAAWMAARVKSFAGWSPSTQSCRRRRPCSHRDAKGSVHGVRKRSCVVHCNVTVGPRAAGPWRRRVFSHVMIGSNDLDRSKRFYDALIATMGGEPGVIVPRTGSSTTIAAVG